MSHPAKLEPVVRVEDVRAQLGVSRAQAYRLLSEAVGRPAGARGSVWPPDLAKDCERLLEERKRLLEALRALESPCPDATSRAMLFQRQEEARLAARAAIAFAEEKAP